METRESRGGEGQEGGKEREEGEEERPPVEGGEHGGDEAKAAAPT